MTWDFEWFKALHLLREGEQLPSRPPKNPLDAKTADQRIEVLKRLPPEKLLEEEPPPALDEKGHPSAQRHFYNFFAEQKRAEQIALFRSRKPREIEAAAQRRAIWRDLCTARRRPALRDACDRWARLKDVRGLGFGVFPEHVKANENEFLEITSSPRFPTSRAADDSRMKYLAHGMAGVMVGVSPMTSIERLRNMSHKKGGPLWSEKSGRCACWRCVVEYWNALEERFGDEEE